MVIATVGQVFNVFKTSVTIVKVDELVYPDQTVLRAFGVAANGKYYILSASVYPTHTTTPRWSRVSSLPK